MRRGDAHQAVVACHECDALQPLPALASREVALCGQCRSLLHRYLPPDAVERSLALHLTALILFALANLLPFIGLRIGGMQQTDLLLSGPAALFSLGHIDVAVVVLLTSVVLPLLSMVGALYLLVPTWLGRRPSALGPVFRFVHAIMPWSMVSVFMLGVIVTVVKLLDMAEVEFGLAMGAYVLLVPVLVLAQLHFNPRLFWREANTLEQPLKPGLRACHLDLLHCHVCTHLMPRHGEAQRCPRCGARVHARKPESVQRTWALLLTGIMLFIPANLFPIMTVTRLGQGEPNTILEGVFHLVDANMWGIAMIVFFASIMVPISKFAALFYLLWSTRRAVRWRAADRTRLYRVVEAIGAWSMVDVFVISLLVSLVQFGSLASIHADIAASFFAATVIVTMLASQSFDPRLLWDAMDRHGGDAAYA